MIKQILNADIKTSWKFSFYYFLPCDFYLYLEDLDKFIYTFREYSYTDFDSKERVMHALGQILGRTANIINDSIQAKNIRKCLELLENDAVDSGYIIGLLNNRGCISVDNGKEHFTFAENLENLSNTFGIQYPRTAKIFRMLAEHYKNEGNSMKIFYMEKEKMF